MDTTSTDYDSKTGLPLEEGYLEVGLPSYLVKSLEAMKQSWARIDKGEVDLHWDCYWCDLNADINYAEVEQEISHRQAAYLRRTYLRMEEEP